MSQEFILPRLHVHPETHVHTCQSMTAHTMTSCLPQLPCLYYAYAAGTVFQHLCPEAHSLHPTLWLISRRQ